MIDQKLAPYAALLLRLTTGVLFVVHGLTKLLVFTPAGTSGFFESLGLPGWMGIVVMIAEIAGGAALILGVATRLVSALFVAILLGAAVTAHGASFGWSSAGGGWEFPVMWALVQASLVLLGDGIYALYPLRLRRS